MEHVHYSSTPKEVQFNPRSSATLTIFLRWKVSYFQIFFIRTKLFINCVLFIYILTYIIENYYYPFVNKIVQAALCIRSACKHKQLLFNKYNI